MFASTVESFAPSAAFAAVADLAIAAGAVVAKKLTFETDALVATAKKALFAMRRRIHSGLLLILRSSFVDPKKC